MRDIDTRISDRARSVGDVPAVSPVLPDDIESAVLACVARDHHTTSAEFGSATSTTVRTSDANATAHACAGATHEGKP